MKKNNKGFTLVELLAVIVVLAIIMVIATQQINKTIAKSRADSFVDSYGLIIKTIDMCDAQDLTADQCKASVNLSSDDYDFTLAESSGAYTITLSGKGQFAKMNLTTYYQNADGTADDKKKIKHSTEVEATSISGSYTPSS